MDHFDHTSLLTSPHCNVHPGALAYVSLMDNNGTLFGVCPVEAFPGPAVEKVTDSSRYFVLRLVDEKSRLLITDIQEYIHT
jgi:hypothetical protein